MLCTLRRKLCYLQKSFRYFSGASLNDLCKTSNIFMHFTYKFLLTLHLLVCFEQINPAWFFFIIFWMAYNMWMCAFQHFFLFEEMKYWKLKSPLEKGIPVLSHMSLSYFWHFLARWTYFGFLWHCCFFYFCGNSIWSWYNLYNFMLLKFFCLFILRTIYHISNNINL